MAEFGRHQLRRIGVDGVVARHHHAALHQDLDDVDAAPGHAVGEFRHRDGFRDHHFARARNGGRLLLAMGAIELTAEGGDRAHTLFVVRKRPRYGELAGATASGRCLTRGRCLDRSLATLLRRALIFLFGEVAGPLDRGCGGSRRCAGFDFLFFQTTSGFLLGAAAGFLFGGLARFFFGLASLGRFAFAAHAVFFDGAACRILFGALARFFFEKFRVSQGTKPRFFLVFGKLAQDDAATAGSRATGLLAKVRGWMQCLLGGDMLGRRPFGLGHALARRHAGALLLHHDRFAAAMAEALANRRGFGALQRQCLTAARARTAVIRLAHSFLSPTIPQLENGQAGISPALPPHRQKNLPRPTA